MGLIRRGVRFYVRYKNEAGRWVTERTPYLIGQEELAERYARALEREVEHRIEAGLADGAFTVKAYGERWIKTRRARKLRSVDDDESRLKHARAIEHLPLEEVRPSHLRELILALRARTGAEELAPRTIRHVYATLSTMFRDAVAEELIRATPCVLERGVVPPKVDADPIWRSSAIFTRAEVEAVLADERIPEDRRTFYALLFLAGVRFGEAAALRWRFYDPTLEPLGRLIVATAYNVKSKQITTTKTGVTREVPVHPALASVLATWKLGGFFRMVGRAPEADDLLVPSRNGDCRSVNHMLKRFHQDLETLGLRPRRQHDARRTFITLARGDGARKDLLEVVTHGPRGDIVDLYTSFPWAELCAEVAKLRVAIRSVAAPVARLDGRQP